jgi:hypothetical protein
MRPLIDNVESDATTIVQIGDEHLYGDFAAGKAEGGPKFEGSDVQVEQKLNGKLAADP